MDFTIVSLSAIFNLNQIFVAIMGSLSEHLL